MCASKKRKRESSLDPGDTTAPKYEHEYARLELDSHADTCAFGKTCLVLAATGRTVDVGGFQESIGSVRDVRIVHAAVAYDCPTSFKTFLLIYHEILYIPDMDDHLGNPCQMRDQGIVVNDIPLQHMPVEERAHHSHSIIDEESSLHIPLTIKGTMSGFSVRKPTWEEVHDDEKSIKVHMTSHAEWKPHSQSYAEIESALQADLDRGIDSPRNIGLTQARGQVVGDETDQAHMHPAGDQAGDNAPASDPADGDACDVEDSRLFTLKALQQQQDFRGVLDIDQYADALMNELGVSELGAQGMASKLASATTRKKRPGFVGPEQLAKNWKIGLEAAKRTCEATTQDAVRDFSTTTGGRRLKPRTSLDDGSEEGYLSSVF